MLFQMKYFTSNTCC